MGSNISNKLISVIIPCYNYGKFLIDAVDSVLNQTYKQFEIIIINDGSTDEDTISILNKIDNPKIRIFHISHSGPSISRNVGLKEATGEYIQFLDADDILHPEKFEMQINALKNTNRYALCYCDYFTSSENDLNKEFPARYKTPRFKTENYLEEIILNWEDKISIPIHTILFSANLYKEFAIYFDEELPNHVDWDFWIKIFSRKPDVLFISEKLVTYRIHNHSICSDKKKMRLGFLMAINNQKKLNYSNKNVVKLLTMKEHFLKYGSKSQYRLVAFILGIFNKKISKFKRVLKYVS